MFCCVLCELGDVDILRVRKDIMLCMRSVTSIY
jgi:hypothetical protein